MLLIQRARQKAVPRRIVPTRIMGTSCRNAEPRACPIGSSAPVLVRVHEALRTAPSRWAWMIGLVAIRPTICSRTPIVPYRSEQLVSASTRCGRYFHCKEQSRNNGRSVLQPTVCIAPARVRGCGGWCRTSSFRRVFELGQAFLEAFRRERPHVGVDHLGEVGGFRRREIAQVS